MGDRLKELRERSQKRRQLLAQQLGLSSPENLRSALSSKEDQAEAEASLKRDATSPSGSGTPPLKRLAPDDISVGSFDTSVHGAGAGYPQEDLRGAQYIEEEEVYTDSSAFLKGTQSANPHNDYCQHFVDTGERPQNFIRDVGLANRFEEYPKLRELIRLKDELIQQTATPPMYLNCDLETFDLHDMDCKFDVILIEPPLEEYQRRYGATSSSEKYWSWEEIERLEIEHVAAQRSFLWIWCGSSDGLDSARRCLKKWGFRRCEDICWIKTNIKRPGHNKNLEPRAIFQRTKEHCLMGIKGTVRRSTDGDFIHANVDIDLIIDEEPELGSKEKPVEIFHMIEHFCLGRRRLHIFGRDSSIRPGWLTIGPELTSSNFDSETYNGYFNKEANGHMTGCSEEIERLRPKSPPPKVKGENSGAADSRGSRRGGNTRGGARGGPSSRGGPNPRGGSLSRGKGGPMRGGYGGRGRGGHRGGMPPR